MICSSEYLENSRSEVIKGIASTSAVAINIRSNGSRWCSANRYFGNADHAQNAHCFFIGKQLANCRLQHMDPA